VQHDKRFESSGLVCPLPADMTDGGLEGALYANRRSKRVVSYSPSPQSFCRFRKFCAGSLLALK
jgi:hypothetical protein